MNNIIAFFEKIWDALLSFNLTTDLLDVIFVAFVIYEAIKFIRGSRSFHLIKGIGLLGLLYLCVKLIHMEASEFLLSTVFKDAFIIIVVLFSPEIRSILERFGRRSITDFSFFNFKSDGAYDSAVTDLVNDFCKAAAELSETKTGALVVFEREAPLNEVIKSGTVLDAQSSPELFNGLFFKNSALHDGAVVVKNARIYSAGCILPLTQNNSLSSELGTRHRAAIGMSEQSDAVVVVVSEETGNISVAVNGKLRRDIQTGNLREILLSSLVSEKKEKTKKKKRGEQSDEKQE
ncbi:MAG: diadenylate cyclase CdaA [Clostridia bacterium]|nr:diadenylate cyclase CdaA [Clostridia bacterium]